MESLFTINKDNADKVIKLLYDRYKYKKTHDFEFISLYPDAGGHIVILHPLHTGKLNFIIDDDIIDDYAEYYFIILPIKGSDYSSEDDNMDIHMSFETYGDLTDDCGTVHIYWNSKRGKMHIETGGGLGRIEIASVLNIAARLKNDIKSSLKYFSNPNLTDAIFNFDSMNINPDDFPNSIGDFIEFVDSGSKDEANFDLFLDSPIYCGDALMFHGTNSAHVYGIDNIEEKTGSVDFGKAKIIR